MATLYILSDLHLEAEGFIPDAQALERCDAVILAGDIHPGLDGIRWAAKTFGDVNV